ncbi:MAG: tetratricopeptide repeat protein [Deltaproteobacteria bacterium]|nr:MAG: tetratricopeptide repeat protein [Deltaproteobacteria bacterium]
MNREQAIAQVTALFGDGGVSVLSAAQLPSWEIAFSVLSDAGLEVEDDGDRIAGERLLERIRDGFARQGLLRQAIAMTRGILRSRVSRLGEDHPASLVELGALGALADRAGRGDEALEMLEKAFEGLRTSGQFAAAVVAGNLGVARQKRGDADGAGEAFALGYAIRKAVAPESAALVASQLAEIRLQQGMRDEAIELMQESYALYRAQLGPTHPRVVTRAQHLAKLLDGMRRYLKSEPLYRDLHAAAEASGSAEAIAEAGFELGASLMRVRLEQEGIRHIERAVEATRRMGDHPALPHRLSLWAQIQLQRGRQAEAEGYLLEALEVEKRLFGENSPEVAVRTAAIGHLYAQQGRHGEAMGWLDPAVSLLRSTRGDKDNATRTAVGYLLDLLDVEIGKAEARHDRQLARDLLGHALEMSSAVLGKGDVRTNRIRDKLGL